MGDPDPKPSLDACLAYVVVKDHERWLGTSSPRALDVFLSGAAERVRLANHMLPAWRLYGPLEEPDFLLPLVARTGDPSLAISWATALETFHFCLADAWRELERLITNWFNTRGFRTGTLSEQTTDLAQVDDVRLFLKRVAQRPGMFLGDGSAWSLYCYLAGMDRGGDWLGVPALEGLRPIIKGIERRSREVYGSTFAAFRVYRESPADLLAWVGI